MIVREHFEIRQTAVTIVTDAEFIPTVKDALFEARSAVEAKCSADRAFAASYDPVEPCADDHPIIKRMCCAAKRADVGPMASVAAAIGTFAVETAKDRGATFCIVENGGDIAILSDRPVTVGLFAGDATLKDVSLKLPPAPNITGICSSSGKIGPSVSFGHCDIATVLSDDPVLADACATRLGNLVKHKDDLSGAVEYIGSIDGVTGCIALCDGMVAMFGDVPELVPGTFESSMAAGIRLTF